MKNLPAMTWVPSLGREDPLGKEMATRFGVLAWRIPWTEELGRLQSKGSQRVRQDSVTNTSTRNKGLLRHWLHNNKTSFLRQFKKSTLST